MFYEILISAPKDMSFVPSVIHTLGFYRKVDNAKAALMDWARGVIALSPDRRYKEIPPDPRASEKTILHVRIVTTGNNPKWNKTDIEGKIVERQFADKDELSEADKTFSAKTYEIFKSAQEKVASILAPGEAITVPYDPDDVDGNNTTIFVEGRHKYFNIDVTEISKDEEGALRIAGVDENGKNYADLKDYDIPDDQWPFFADVIIELKEQATTL